MSISKLFCRPSSAAPGVVEPQRRAADSGASSPPSPPLPPRARSAASGEASLPPRRPRIGSADAAAFRRMDRLIGATIDPQTANALLPVASPYAGPVRFDSFGRIEGFNTHPSRPAPAALIEQLEAAVIAPLTRTNARAPKDAPRPERDLLVHAMRLLGLYDNADNAALLRQAKALFLSSSFDRAAVGSFLQDATRRLAADPLLKDQIDKLAGEAAKPVTTPQRADNLYGRTFESLLAEDLVLHPPQGVLDAAAVLGRGMFDTVAAMTEGRDALMKEFTNMLSDGARPWFAHSPSLQDFARWPSMETFAECVGDTSSGIEAVKVMHMAQRFVHSINNVSERGEMERPDWYRRCLDYYSDFLSTQKPDDESPLDLTARNPGVWLHYQPNAATIENPAHGKNLVHARLPKADALSLFEQDAFTRGQTVVNGLSGQTGMVSFFARHLADSGAPVSMNDVHLGMLTTLVFNGGHSTEEVLATVHALKPLHAGDGTDPAMARAFRGGYEALLDLAGSEASRQDLAARLERAVDRTVQYCAEHVA